jgi:hypothetical protein
MMVYGGLGGSSLGKIPENKKINTRNCSQNIRCKVSKQKVKLSL